MKLKTDKKMKRITVCAAVCMIAGVVFLAVNLIAYFDGVMEADRLKNLSATARAETAWPAPAEKELTPAAPGDAIEPETAAPMSVLPKYEKLLELNDEVSGWIKIDGTRIDYPFLQHRDNDYYLHTNIENKKSVRGCVYIDYRNDRELKNKNTLVYGHNMKDGSMFKDLVRYKNKDFFNLHGIIHMDSLYEESDWQVFSVYVVDADKETIDPDYPDEESFIKELNRFKDRSMYKTDIQLSSNDRVITLVTCSYETKNSRTIVHAKHID